MEKKIDTNKFITLYPKLTDKELASYFKVKAPAISKKASKLGLSRKDIQKKVKQDVLRRTIFSESQNILNGGFDLMFEIEKMIADTKVMLLKIGEKIEKNGNVTVAQRREIVMLHDALARRLKEWNDYLNLLYKQEEVRIFMDALKEIFGEISPAIQQKFILKLHERNINLNSRLLLRSISDPPRDIGEAKVEHDGSPESNGNNGATN
jgi:DNA-binding transcriptional regulator GbsR (MarR family)